MEPERGAQYALLPVKPFQSVMATILMSSQNDQFCMY